MLGGACHTTGNWQYTVLDCNCGPLLIICVGALHPDKGQGQVNTERVVKGC